MCKDFEDHSELRDIKAPLYVFQQLQISEFQSKKGTAEISRNRKIARKRCQLKVIYCHSPRMAWTFLPQPEHQGYQCWLFYIPADLTLFFPRLNRVGPIGNDMKEKATAVWISTWKGVGSLT